jgi:hypothetical protein
MSILGGWRAAQARGHGRFPHFVLISCAVTSALRVSVMVKQTSTYLAGGKQDDAMPDVYIHCAGDADHRHPDLRKR